MPRLRMFENDWVSVGNPKDLEVPPFGRTLNATYHNGDAISITFRSVNDPEDLAARLPHLHCVTDLAADRTDGRHGTPPLLLCLRG